MTLKLDNNTTEVELTSGKYHIYIVGGFSVNAGDHFRININFNNENVVPTEYKLKERSIVGGKRAVKYYHFNLIESGNYKISIDHYENIAVKRSMLYFTKMFQNSVDLNGIEIEIVKK